MRKTWFFACTLLFVSAVSFAQAPSQPSLPREALAAILGQPAAGSCATQPDGARQAAKRPRVLREKVDCSVTCESGTILACPSGTGSCSASNPSCGVNGMPGYVTCDGTTYSCPACQQPTTCYTGTCFSSVQCYSICSAGGVEPTSYICDRLASCCVCSY